jgi:hypothetical protein
MEPVVIAMLASSWGIELDIGSVRGPRTNVSIENGPITHHEPPMSRALKSLGMEAHRTTGDVTIRLLMQRSPPRLRPPLGNTYF